MVSLWNTENFKIFAEAGRKNLLLKSKILARNCVVNLPSRAPLLMLPYVVVRTGRMRANNKNS